MKVTLMVHRQKLSEKKNQFSKKKKKKKSEYSYNNGREFLKFGDVEIEKQVSFF